MIFKNRGHEFFEAGSGRLSMSRLLCFLAFWPAAWVVVSNPSADTLGWFLGAFVLGYVGGKSADAVFSPGKGKDSVRNVANSDSSNI